MTCPSIWRMDAPLARRRLPQGVHLDAPGRARLFSQGEAYVCIDGASIPDRAQEIAPARGQPRAHGLGDEPDLAAGALPGGGRGDGRELLRLREQRGLRPLRVVARVLRAPTSGPWTTACPRAPSPRPAGRKRGLIDFGREVFGFLHLTSAAPAPTPSTTANRRGRRSPASRAKPGMRARSCARARRSACLARDALLSAWTARPTFRPRGWREEYNGLPLARRLLLRGRAPERDPRRLRPHDGALHARILPGRHQARPLGLGRGRAAVRAHQPLLLSGPRHDPPHARRAGRDPFNQHINTILDYTFYWMIAVWEDYFYTAILVPRGMYEKMVSAMDYTLRFTSADGFCRGAEAGLGLCGLGGHAQGGRALRRAGAAVEGAARPWRTARRSWARLRTPRPMPRGPARCGTASSRCSGPRRRARSCTSAWTARCRGTALCAAVRAAVRPPARGQGAPCDGEHAALRRSARHHHAPTCAFTRWMRSLRARRRARCSRACAPTGAACWTWAPRASGSSSTPNETGGDAMYGRPFGRSLCHCWGAGPVYLCGRHIWASRPRRRATRSTSAPEPRRSAPRRGRRPHTVTAPSRRCASRTGASGFQHLPRGGRSPGGPQRARTSPCEGIEARRRRAVGKNRPPPCRRSGRFFGNPF